MTTLISVDSELQYLVLSDIHLGARGTSAEDILSNLTTFFGNFEATSQFTQLDAIFIAGDLWNNAISLHDKVTQQSISWLHRLLNFCQLYNISLRLMEGTPFHDRKQNQTVSTLVKLITPSVDFRYIDEIEIEYFEKLGLHVLYVPDEARHTAAAVEEDVASLILSKGLEKVDIAIMHGMFEYQLGTIPMNNKVHNAGWYLDHVKYYISIGHVHTCSQFNRILAQGSFDRLSHGEEEPKGAMLIRRDVNGEWMHWFIENKHAKIYKTIEVRGPVEGVLKTIGKALTKIPFGSYIRIAAKGTHPIFQGFETLRNMFPLYTFTKKAVEEVKETSVTQAVSYVPVVLNEATIVEAICEEVFRNAGLDLEAQRLLRLKLEALQ